jgi:hypothetical protein
MIPAGLPLAISVWACRPQATAVAAVGCVCVLLTQLCWAGPQVKASVGATGTMMLLDISTNRCHMARLGKAMPFATTTKGAGQ